MAQDHDSHEDGVSRRHALERMMWAGTGILWAVSGGVSKRFSLFGRAEAASAMAQTKPTIAVIVKDTTSFYWQTVFAGARKAGRDLGVNIAELGAQSESDINGQISILESAVATNPAAIVISHTSPVESSAAKNGNGEKDAKGGHGGRGDGDGSRVITDAERGPSSSTSSPQYSPAPCVASTTSWPSLSLT